MESGQSIGTLFNSASVWLTERKCTNFIIISQKWVELKNTWTHIRRTDGLTNLD